MNVATRTTRRKGVVTTTVHAVRAPNDIWAAAEKRAEREGIKMNRLIVELLEGYGRKIYRLPQQKVETVRVYGESASAEEASPAA